VSAHQLADRPSTAHALALADALEQIAALAADLDARPRFPSESFAALKAAGVPQLAADRHACGLRREIALVRACAAADASTARILDGHLNGVERLALCAPDPLRESELDGVARGELLLGVWGADPGPGEGTPAGVERDGGAAVLSGVKTFCSGAGGVQRALVVVRDAHETRRLAYVDVRSSIRIDRDWYRASGLRSSESHRVEFDRTPVLALLGGADELMREPWLSRDAVRTAATWAGIADGILAAVVAALDGPVPDEVRLHGVGRIRVALSSIDRWLEHTSLLLEDVEAIDGDDGRRPRVPQSPRALAAECRLAVSDAARLIAAEAARVCGSRALVGSSPLDRARRDLDLFLLQHRLDPKLVELGALTLGGAIR
jgi:alkylation response protein AidB-like acyl-CoA dehydrogenase